MKLEIARVILFAKDMRSMTRFYEDVIGLGRISTPDDSPGWVAFDAGGCQLALHEVPAPYAKGIETQDPPVPRHGAAWKVAFRARDVAAAREAIAARGANVGPVKTFGDLHLCDGIDPEGNVFQLSNRA